MTPPDLDALLTRDESRRVDAALVAAGFPSLVLMENAGSGAADAITKLARHAGITRATVMIGPGNNGGDGLVVARQLALADIAVDVVAISDPTKMRGDAAAMRDAWTATGGTIVAFAATVSDAELRERLRTELLIDALFGTGLTRELDGLARRCVAVANEESRTLSIALDVPSGLDVDTGTPLGAAAVAFRATHTFTFGTSKPGLHTGHGIESCGDVAVIDLGVAVPAAIASAAHAWLIRSARIAPRASHVHKGDNGRVLVVGGSAGTTGAAVLAALGAHGAGAGLVRIASRDRASIDAKVLETMSMSLPDDAESAIARLTEALEQADASVIGPGLGSDAWAEGIVARAITKTRRAVFDADALTLLARHGRCDDPGDRVLTPHPLEMARLLGAASADAVNADRLEAARSCAARYHSVVVLKGAGSVIASPEGRVAICPIADASLAIGGSGDVLGGAIAARMAEREPRTETFDAVVQAVFAHAKAGRAVGASHGSSRGAMAHEIADALGRALEHA